MQIDSDRALAAWLDTGRTPAAVPEVIGRRVAVRDADLTAYEQQLLAHDDLQGLVVLGAGLPKRLLHHLVDAGAVVFPDVPDTPVQIYRGLYDAHELYAGLDRGYAATPDARAYAWASDDSLREDDVTSLLRAIHDDSMRDGLHDALDGRRVVGVMGGHALRRGSGDFARAARLGHALAQDGFVVVTGGGPGAMEAANLGAWARDEAVLDAALRELAAVPDFADVGAWARVALQVKDAHRVERDGNALRSIGVPTWFYGHEPPNVFEDAVAKFFSNALREDDLLTASVAGLIVLPGAAGTVQEIFQAITPRYYAPAPPVHGRPVGLDAIEADGRPAPLVLVGHEHWTETLPVWPLVQAMARGRDMADSVFLVDDLEEVQPLLRSPEDRAAVRS